MTDNSKPYSEVCSMIRHYSNASLTVRTLCFVQGLAFLATWSIYFNLGNTMLSWMLPVCGLFFTLMTFLFHNGYYTTTGEYYRIARQLEKELFTDKTYHPFHKFHEYHEKKFNQRMAKMFIINAPFSMIATAFAIALAISLYK